MGILQLSLALLDASPPGQHTVSLSPDMGSVLDHAHRWHLTLRDYVVEVHVVIASYYEATSCISVVRVSSYD